jgi:hypothetical protein
MYGSYEAKSNYNYLVILRKILSDFFGMTSEGLGEIYRGEFTEMLLSMVTRQSIEQTSEQGPQLARAEISCYG